MIKKGLFIVFFIVSCHKIWAQTINKPVDVKQANADLAAAYREPFDKKREMVFQNKKYRLYNNYLSAGAGKGYNGGWKDWEFNSAIDYNFHIRKAAFQMGGFLMGPALFDNNLVQFHGCWGYRIDRYNYLLAFYGGLSYMAGYSLKTTPGIAGNDSTYKQSFKAFGVYAAAQFYYKIKFDYGLGLTAFVDANAVQSIYGIRVELFFSGAYRGLKKHNYTKEAEERIYN